MEQCTDITKEDDQQTNYEFISLCCEAFNEANRTSRPDVSIRYSSIVELYTMLFEAVIFFALLMYLDSGSYGQLRSFVSSKVGRRRMLRTTVDEDLEREEQHVRALIASHDLSQEALAVLELSKVNVASYLTIEIS